MQTTTLESKHYEFPTIQGQMWHCQCHSDDSIFKQLQVHEVCHATSIYSSLLPFYKGCQQDSFPGPEVYHAIWLYIAMEWMRFQAVLELGWDELGSLRRTTSHAQSHFMILRVCTWLHCVIVTLVAGTQTYKSWWSCHFLHEIVFWYYLENLQVS